MEDGKVPAAGFLIPWLWKTVSAVRGNQGIVVGTEGIQTSRKKIRHTRSIQAEPEGASPPAAALQPHSWDGVAGLGAL